jgi:hypothetical protein
MFLRAEGKGVHVNTFIGATSVSLVRLNPREVRTFTLRESVLAVQLELSSDNGVLAPAMHVQRGLSEDEGTGIRHTRVIHVGSRVSHKVSGSTSRERNSRASQVHLIVRVGRTMPVPSEGSTKLALSSGLVVKSTSILEKTTSINEGSAILGNGSRATESMDSVRKSINGIRVVEGLSTKHLEQKGIASQRRAIIHVLIRLYDPDELLHGVIEVQLDLVAGRTNRLVTSELELSNQVLMGVLGHSSALVSVQEHIVNVQRGSNQGLVVSNGGRNRSANRVLSISSERRTS